jgi:hypothetical protein
MEGRRYWMASSGLANYAAAGKAITTADKAKIRVAIFFTVVLGETLTQGKFLTVFYYSIRSGRADAQPILRPQNYY